MKRNREPPETDGPLLSLRKMTNFDYIKGAIPEWVIEERAMDDVIMESHDRLKSIIKYPQTERVKERERERERANGIYKTTRFPENMIGKL